MTRLQAGTQVFSTGQTAAQRGESKWPSHSVHNFGLITYMSRFNEIAALGHSNSQAPHTVHWEAIIL
jgi:hypothetical protein